MSYPFDFYLGSVLVCYVVLFGFPFFYNVRLMPVHTLRLVLYVSVSTYWLIFHVSRCGLHTYVHDGILRIRF